MKALPAFPRSLILLALAGWGIAPLLHAELTDEQKRALFLESHHAAQATPSPTPHQTHHTPPQNTPPQHSTTHHASASAEPAPTHTAHSVKPPFTPPPAPTATPATPAASESVLLPHGANPSAPITIEKSGVEQAQGEEPAPEAPSTGIFGWLFGGGGPSRSYHYLSASTRAAIDRAHVRKGRWKYIIVHNSGTREGNARIFDIYHLRVRHMKNGLAYHFVIGDGHGSGDGQIEIGHRWTAQLNGGHVASDYLNDISLGICLVGDFNRDLPTKAQIGALEELIDYLRQRVGKCQGRRAIVYAHKEINPRPTDCPGDRFPYNWLHGRFR